eukprot:SAG31_NODE_316_length_17841_cov_33.716154_4_plen_1183_part_00
MMRVLLLNFKYPRIPRPGNPELQGTSFCLSSRQPERSRHVSRPCILLGWYCRPTNLEKRPRYLRTRSELEALDKKHEVYRFSRSLRRCVALATLRKRFKAWRMKTKNEKYDRIGQVVGIAFLLIVMFQPVAEGSTVVSLASSSTNVTQHHNETALVNATNVHTDMNQLQALNLDPGLKEFIGALVMGFQSQLGELKRENAAVGAELARVKNKTEILETKLEQVTKDKSVLENNTHLIRSENTALKTRVASLEIIAVQLSNKTATNSQLLKAAVENISIRLDQCEQESFEQIMNRRRSQATPTVSRFASSPDVMQEIRRHNHRRSQEEIGPCQGQALVTRVNEINEACCGSTSSNGHRLLQGDSGDGGDCSGLPERCSSSCAPVFVALRDECGQVMEAGFDMRQVERLYERCKERMSLDGGTCGAQIGRRLQRTSSATNGISGATTAMIIPLTIMTNVQTGTLEVLLQSGRRHRLQEDGAGMLQEFRCECGSSTDISKCIPVCSEAIHGYELLLTIDQSDLRVSCKLHAGLYSWAGAVSEGSYFGDDPTVFISTLISGAIGQYNLNLQVGFEMRMVLTIHQDQRVRITGDRTHSISAPTWDGGGFVVLDGASMTLEYVALVSSIVNFDALSFSEPAAPILTVHIGGLLSVVDSVLVPAGWAELSRQSWTLQKIPLPCDGTADGVCHGPHDGQIVVDTPLSISLDTPLVCGFWTNDCAALPLGVTGSQRMAGIASGVPWNADPICFNTDYYTVADDASFTVAQATADRAHYRSDDLAGPFELGQGGSGWYRLPEGKRLPTARTGYYQCGTRFTGWLSGWPAEADGLPNPRYAEPANGTLPPPVGHPPSEGTVCFSNWDSEEQSNGPACTFPIKIRAVNCGPFALWELPPPGGKWNTLGDDGGTSAGYCLTNNRLCADCIAAGRCVAAVDPSHGDSLCSCGTGWAGLECNNWTGAEGRPLGLNEEQHDKAVAGGVDPSADPVCFTTAFFTVPESRAFELSVAATIGNAGDMQNYDPSMPSKYRCDGWPGKSVGLGHGVCNQGSECVGPFGLGQRNTSWYRLPSGRTLATAPPQNPRCGTAKPGWVSGTTLPSWSDSANDFTTGQGTLNGSVLPPVGAPPLQYVVCFKNPWYTCFGHVRIRVVNCGAFALWELPPLLGLGHSTISLDEPVCGSAEGGGGFAYCLSQ